VLVLAACAAWALITGAVHQGRPEGVLLAVLAVAAGYACGRIGGALLPVAAPCAGALAGAALAVTGPGLAAGPRPAASLGQVGATAAVLALSTGAACCAARAASAPALRLGLHLMAVAVATTAVAASAGAVICCAGVLLGSPAVGRTRHRGAVLAVLAAVPVVVAGTIWALAARALPGEAAGVLADLLTGHRVGLWQEALSLAHRHPVAGIGPGRFADFSTVAAPHPLPDGTPHSALLQQAVEQGLVGVALSAAAWVWVMHALWRSERPTPVVLAAGVALTVVASVALLGDALSFTAVPVGAGLLAGMATARPLTEETGAEETGVPESA